MTMEVAVSIAWKDCAVACPEAHLPSFLINNDKFYLLVQFYHFLNSRCSIAHCYETTNVERLVQDSNLRTYCAESVAATKLYGMYCEKGKFL